MAVINIDHRTYQHALKHFEQVIRQYIEQQDCEIPLIQLFRFYVMDIFKVDPVHQIAGRDNNNRSDAKHCLRFMLLNYTTLSQREIGRQTFLRDHSGVSTSRRRHYQLLHNPIYAKKANKVEEKIKQYLYDQR